MADDFQSFLVVFRGEGAASARASADSWREQGKIDATQYALMISHIERRSGNIEASISIINKAVLEGGEVAPLSISLAEDYIHLQNFHAAVDCCNKAIRDSNEAIACRFLSSALLLKSYALSKLGETEIAETILEILRPDLNLFIDGKLETPKTLIARK